MQTTINKKNEIENLEVEAINSPSSNLVSNSTELFPFNNCYDENNGNRLIKLLNELNLYIWLSDDGEYIYRKGKNGKTIKVNEKKIKTIIRNQIGISITINSDNPDNDKKNLDSRYLKLVSKDSYDHHEKEEFYEVDGEIHRNQYRSTEYRGLDVNTPYKKPDAIVKLVKNLVNNDEERYNYFINWLAYFFQFMIKQPVAIVIKGTQGSGKNLFVEKVLKPLFGKEQVSVLGNKEIRKQFTASLFENRSFIVLDEVSHSYKDNYELQNFLKEVIGSDLVYMETKHKNTKEPIQIHGPVIIFSNKSIPIAIETNSRREVIFNTGESLMSLDFLGHGTYEELCHIIENELKDFALMLHNYKVDKKMATTAMDTTEKRALAEATHDKIALFHEAIISKDKEYFEILQDSSFHNLYYNLCDDLDKNKIDKRLIAKYYNEIYEDNMSSKRIMDILRTYNPEFYDNTNTIGDGNGGKYFLLDGHPRKNKKEETIEVVEVQDSTPTSALLPNDKLLPQKPNFKNLIESK